MTELRKRTHRAKAGLLARLKSSKVRAGIALQLIGTLTLVQGNITLLGIPPQYVGWATVIVGTAIGLLQELAPKKA